MNSFESLATDLPNRYIGQRIEEYRLDLNKRIQVEQIPATGVRKVLERLHLLKPQCRLKLPDIQPGTFRIVRVKPLKLPVDKGE